MNTKRSTVALSLSAFLPIGIGVGFATVEFPERIAAYERLSFDPLMYLTIFLAVTMLASIVVSIVLSRKLKYQKELACANSSCHNNPLSRMRGEGVFDYRDMETPEELTDHRYVHVETPEELTEQGSLQGDVALEEVFSFLEAQEPSGEERDFLVEEEISLIVAQEPSYKIRDFVVEDAMSRLTAQKPAYEAKHQRQPAKTAPQQLIQIVPDIKDAQRRVREIPSLAADYSKPSLYEVPVELEYLLRKIS